MSASPGILARVVEGVSVALYDFDGPLCGVFAGIPAEGIARRIELLLGTEVDTDDPLEVLRQAGGTHNVDQVEDALIAAEIDAVDCATTTAGGVESVRAALNAGIRVGIVSNNSRAAVDRFLDRTGLLGQVWPVIGRPYAMPARMKPNPWPLVAALDTLDARPSAAVFIGDSATDIEAAEGAAMRCVAFANKAGKRELFETNAAVVIDSMWELHAAFSARR